MNEHLSGMPEAVMRSPKEKLWGLVTRKERWHLSWRGWLLLLMLGVACVTIGVFNVYPFLAVSSPVQADVLVVEGWIHGYAIKAAAEQARAGGYRAVYVTGGPVTGSGNYTNDFNTYASVGAEQLIGAGVPRHLVQPVASHEAGRDRTYSSALALRDWLEANDTQVRKVNVMTENAHARRTLLLFQDALPSAMEVGVIPLANPDYDPKRWWRYSEGVRDVIGESLAYIYAKFVFRPKANKA